MTNTHTVPLREIAGARSGDKGNISNVCVWVYEPRHYEAVKAALSVERLKATHPTLWRGAIERFERRLNDRKKCHHRDAKLDALSRNLQNRIWRVAVNARHGCNRLANTRAFDNEDRINQVIYR